MLNAGERKTAVCQLRPGGTLKAAPTCTCFASISLFVLASQVHVEEQTEGEKASEEQQRADWILEVGGKRREGQHGWGLEKPQRCAPVCCVQLSRALQQRSVGIWENPLLRVRLKGHVAFQTFSGCLFSTRKIPNAAGAAVTKGARTSLKCTSHLSMPRRWVMQQRIHFEEKSR